LTMDNSKLFFESFKSHRENKNVSIKDIAEYTKIDSKYINAIESGDFSIAPNVYIRLFIKSYCEYLDLDYKKALDDYEIYTTGKVDEKIDMTTVSKSATVLDSRTDSHAGDLSSEFNSKSLIGILGIIIVVIILLIFINNVKESSLTPQAGMRQLPATVSPSEQSIPNVEIDKPSVVPPADTTKISS